MNTQSDNKASANELITVLSAVSSQDLDNSIELRFLAQLLKHGEKDALYDDHHIVASHLSRSMRNLASDTTDADIDKLAELFVAMMNKQYQAIHKLTNDKKMTSEILLAAMKDNSQ